ncbi:hypothetical protein [Armatimonas sp.]|uniref:hypothetical protein n=1 Tax=Armatimonas sp. TaxID=1872638 RepID=UPI00374DC00F
MRVLLLPAAALICCLSSGCASDTSRARESARVFLSALQKGELVSMQHVATHAARPNIDFFFPDKKDRQGHFVLGEPRVEENTAEVPATLTDSSTAGTLATVLMRREGKEWRVWGLRLKGEKKPELTFDFEHPERMVGELFGATLGELTKGLKDAEKTGRAFGEALGGFVKGFSEGVEKTAPK